MQVGPGGLVLVKETLVGFSLSLIIGQVLVPDGVEVTITVTGV